MSFSLYGTGMQKYEVTKHLERKDRKVKSLSRVWLFATPWTVAYQAPQSMEFSRQEYWSGLPFPSPERNTWSNRQIWPWNMEWSRAKTNRVLPRKCTGHSKHPLPQQHKRRLYTWTSPDGQHWNHIDSIICSQRWRSSIQSTKTRPGADCGSDHELLIAKCRLKLKEVRKPLDH